MPLPIKSYKDQGSAAVIFVLIIFILSLTIISGAYLLSKYTPIKSYIQGYIASLGIKPSNDEEVKIVKGEQESKIASTGETRDSSQKKPKLLYAIVEGDSDSRGESKAYLSSLDGKDKKSVGLTFINGKEGQYVFSHNQKYMARYNANSVQVAATINSEAFRAVFDNPKLAERGSGEYGYIYTLLWSPDDSQIIFEVLEYADNYGGGYNRKYYLADLNNGVSKLIKSFDKTTDVKLIGQGVQKNQFILKLALPDHVYSYIGILNDTGDLKTINDQKLIFEGSTVFSQDRTKLYAINSENALVEFDFKTGSYKTIVQIGGDVLSNLYTQFDLIPNTEYLIYKNIMDNTQGVISVGTSDKKQISSEELSSFIYASNKSLANFIKKHSNKSIISISPDNHYVLFNNSQSNLKQYFIFDTESQKEEPFTQNDLTDKSSIKVYAWVSD